MRPLVPLLTLATLSASASASLALPWPAEPWAQAVNLTSVEGPIPNDFADDLSGAFWNPISRRLWLCRNGPADTTSKVWCLKENPSPPTTFLVDTKHGVGELAAGRAEWTSFNDAEALTQANLNTDFVYVLAENEEVVRLYDLSIGGRVQTIRTYNTRPHLPLSGGSGAEGLAFIPDGHLFASGFVSPSTGLPMQSSRGLGGLFFIGHQNGGRIYVFDLSSTDSSFTFHGSFASGHTEIGELFFDRSTNRLFILHDNQTLEVTSLSSTVVGAGRKLDTLATYTLPSTANIEGLAVVDNADAVNSRRSLFLTVDDGDATSLLWFKQFPSVCRTDTTADGSVTIDDLFVFINLWFTSRPDADFDFSGSLTVDDIFLFINDWFRPC